MKLTKDDAKELAQCFREISVALGNYRFDHWSHLTEANKASLESKEWTLLNYSSDFITHTVGLILDDTKASLKTIVQATNTAKKTIARISEIKKVINVATSVIGLAAAIATKNPGAIAVAVVGVADAVK